MTKEESVQKFKDAQDVLVGQVFDDGVASVPAGSGGGLSQADCDAQVAAAVSAAQAVDAQALSDAQAAAAAALAALQAQFDAEVAKEQGVVGNLQAALKATQDSIAAVFALFPQLPPQA